VAAVRRGPECAWRSRKTFVMSRRPLWHKNNYGFWLCVCIVISLVFSLIYRRMI
jgi:hypothetical protein